MVHVFGIKPIDGQNFGYHIYFVTHPLTQPIAIFAPLTNKFGRGKFWNPANLALRFFAIIVT